jgi:hypothetical protein
VLILIPKNLRSIGKYIILLDFPKIPCTDVSPEPSYWAVSTGEAGGMEAGGSCGWDVVLAASALVNFQCIEH